MQRNDLEETKRKAKAELMSQYEKLKSTSDALTQQHAEINKALNEKQQALDDRYNEFTQAIDNPLKLVQQKQSAPIGGFVLGKDTRDKLSEVSQKYINARQAAYDAAALEIRRESSSFETEGFGVKHISNNLANQKALINQIDSVTEITEIQRTMKTIEKNFDNINLETGRSGRMLTGLKSDVNDLDTKLIAPAASAQLCKEEIERQQSILNALGILAFINKWKDSTEDYTKRTVLDHIDNLNAWSVEHKDLANQKLIVDVNTQQYTSINEQLEQLLNASKTNEESINNAPNNNAAKTPSINAYPSTQNINLSKEKQPKIDDKRQQNYITLIKYFQQYQKDHLEDGSARREPVRSLNDWLKLQMNDPSIDIKDTLHKMVKRDDYQSIIKSKKGISKVGNILGRAGISEENKSPERLLRETIETFKARIHSPSNSPSSNSPQSKSPQSNSPQSNSPRSNSPSSIIPSSQQGNSTTAQVLKTMPPQSGNRPSVTIDDEADFEQIRKNLQEAMQPLPQSQPQPQPQQSQKNEESSSPGLGKKKY